MRKRNTLKYIILLSIFLIFYYLPAESAVLNIYPIGDAQKVYRDDAPPFSWSGYTGGRITLKAALHEYVSFQLILRASGDTVSGVDISITDLVGPQGKKIPKEDIEILFQRYYYVTAQRTNGRAGWCPDALPPLTAKNPWKGPDANFAPFDIANNQNQGIWFNIYVSPIEHPSGTYSGTVTITSNNAGTTKIPLDLYVWKFTLPKRPFFESLWGLGGGVPRHCCSYPPGSVGYKEFVHNFYDYFVKYKVGKYGSSNTTLYGTIDKQGRIISPVVSCPDFGSSDKEQDYFWQRMSGVGITDFSSPLLDPNSPSYLSLRKQVVEEISRYFQSKGALSVVTYKPGDEPGVSQPNEIERLKNECNFIHSCSIYPLISMPFTNKPAYDVLKDYFDIIIYLYGRKDDPTIEEITNEVHAMGKKIWWYITTTQPGYLSVGSACLLHEMRLIPWMWYKYNVEGFLYWAMWDFVWQNDTWDNADPYRSPWQGSYYEGTGVFMYPGNKVGINKPVASIRMASFRDGVEDYDYFKILSSLGDTATVNTKIATMVTDMSHWNTNYNSLYTARDNMGEAINTFWPTVSFSNLSAQREKNGVIIKWQAAGDISGFNVYRSRTKSNKDWDYEKINPSIIPASSSGTYEYIDREPENLISPNSYYLIGAIASPLSIERYSSIINFSLVSSFSSSEKPAVIFQNYPNPFTTTTTIKYTLKNNSPVCLEIYNLSGELIRTLVNEEQSPGTYYKDWDGKNERGDPVLDGVYIYSLSVGNQTEKKKMILLKE